MKNKITSFTNAVVFTLMILFVFDCNSGDKTSPKQRLMNSEKIKIGMSLDSVNLIMGEPDTVLLQNENDIEKRTWYSYEIDGRSYGDGQITFDSSMKVKEIYFPK